MGLIDFYKRLYILSIAFLLFVMLIGCNNLDKDSELTYGLTVPDGYVISKAVDSSLISYPTFASFDNDGRLFVCESDGTTTSTEDMLKRPHFRIRMLEDTNNDGFFDKSTIFADSITYPMGAAFYDGSLYVAAAPDLLKFTDIDGDGKADKREVLLSGWILNHNAATFGGPYIGPDGWLYLTDARRGYDIVSKEGKEYKGKGANIWRCKPDGTELERVSGGGFDNSVELVFMDAGETVGTMTYFTDPKNGYRDAIMHWVYGGVYPKPFPTIQEDKLKLTGDLMPVMTKLPRIAHSGIMRYEGNDLGEDFEGDLLTAQFNTGKIMRYKIEQDGATFKTTESTFMSSEDKDSHPTDVLQSADGSIFVVNTGGWFIAGCPLSHVAKTDVLGGIYKIEKKKRHKIKDPWGRKITFSELSGEKLVEYLKDSRFPVKNKAIEELVKRENEIIPDIKKLLIPSKNPKLRKDAVFILYRMGTSESMDLVRNFLNDDDEIVRTSTARVLGLAKDYKSLKDLQKLIISDQSPRVRRQIATALGQIGEKESTRALLKASKHVESRFEEHAIIYSLITLKDSRSLMRGLEDSSPKVKKTALIALDQMDESPISQKEVLPFLEDGDSSLIKAGLWVIAHHMDWSDAVVSFIENFFNEKNSLIALDKDVKDLMITFSSKASVQKFIGEKLSDPNLSKKHEEGLLDVVDKSELSDFPAIWIYPLKTLLEKGEMDIKSKVLNLVASKGTTLMNPTLERIIKDKEEDLNFRLKALETRLSSEPQIKDSEFSLLVESLDKKNDLPIRQLSSRVISKSRLNKKELNSMATEVLPKVDKHLLPEILQVFEDNSDKDLGIGLTLSRALQETPDRIELINLSILESLFEGYPNEVIADAKPLFAEMKKREASRLEELENVQEELKRGDVAKGRSLFFGKSICYTCHSIEGQGGSLGPDLTNIGSIRSEHDILEAILFPSASFAREYETSKIVTNNNSYVGIIKEQLSDIVIMQTGPTSNVQIPQSEILSIEPVETSLMPSGLKDNLSNEEFSDLISYLESLPDGLGFEN